MNNYKANMSLENGSVVLSLDTYNAMFRKANLLDSIVDDTISSITVSTREPSEYNNLRVSIDGAFKLPQIIRDELLEAVCQKLIAKPDYVRTLAENKHRYLDLCDFSLSTYNHSSNTLQVDLLKCEEFKELWDEELASEEAQEED